VASVHHHPAGSTSKPWVVRWRDHEGRQRGKRFPTERDARHFATDVERGVHQPQAQSTLTVHDWLRTWFDVHGVAWAKSTRIQRADLVDRHIVPRLGHVRLSELGRPRVLEWRAEVRRSGATPATVNATVRVLSAALGAAVQDGVAPVNPCLGLRPLPQQPVRREPTPINHVEAIRHLLPTPRDQLIVSLMAYCGLRPGEVYALEWADVGDRTLVVRRALGKDGVKATKTGRVRNVPIPTVVRDDLEAVDRAGPLVVRGDKGGFLDHHNWATRVWRPATLSLGLRVSPYSLRHTACSLWIAAGHTIMEVAAWMGHANPNQTLGVYGHLFGEAQFKPGESLDDAVAVARGQASRAALVNSRS